MRTLASLTSTLHLLCVTKHPNTTLLRHALNKRNSSREFACIEVCSQSSSPAPHPSPVLQGGKGGKGAISGHVTFAIHMHIAPNSAVMTLNCFIAFVAQKA